jgi:hypothetical protein
MISEENVEGERERQPLSDLPDVVPAVVIVYHLDTKDNPGVRFQWKKKRGGEMCVCVCV